MKRVLKFITDEMKASNVQYHFMKNKSKKITYPYFVGEILPTEPSTEDGKREFTMLVTGFNRGTYSNLIDVAETIENHFPSVEGLTVITDGQFVAVYFCGSTPLDAGEEELQKIQINLTIKTWKGGN